MKKFGKFTPDWREDVPAADSYRSIFFYDPYKFKHPSAAWVKMFMDEFGMTKDDFTTRQPGGDETVAIDVEVGLNSGQLAALADMVGEDNVSTDDYSRVKYSHGKSLDEDLDLRDNNVRKVADVVVHPRDKDDVKKIVEYANANKIPVSIYGGGSSVVLGINPEGGIALAMGTHMNKVLKINELNQTVTVQPGAMGPDYEEALNQAPERFGTKLRYTGGHFPQSFEISSVGGWIAALGSGQASSYFGDAYDLVIAQEYVTPAGSFKTHEITGTATGPKVNDVMKGSEGAYGVLVEATMKIYRHLPENRERFAFMFPSWNDAVDAAREIAQGEFGSPAVFRISDPEETEIGLRLKGFGDGLLDKFLRWRGLEPMKRSLCIGTAEGEAGLTRHVKKMVTQIAKAHGAMSLTGYATKQWEHGRYDDVHMREDLLDYGIILDTLETGVAWDNLDHLYKGVRAFVKARPHTYCLTHASHFYPQGTNLYFIFMIKPENAEEFYQFREDVISKIVEYGGSVSHHHGIGRMFAPWMEQYLGKEQMDLLRAIKAHLDPNNVMSPGGQLGLDN